MRRYVVFNWILFWCSRVQSRIGHDSFLVFFFFFFCFRPVFIALILNSSHCLCVRVYQSLVWTWNIDLNKPRNTYWRSKSDSCDGRAVQTLGLKSNVIFTRRSKSYSQRHWKSPFFFFRCSSLIVGCHWTRAAVDQIPFSSFVSDGSMDARVRTMVSCTFLRWSSASSSLRL